MTLEQDFNSAINDVFKNETTPWDNESFKTLTRRLWVASVINKLIKDPRFRAYCLAEWCVQEELKYDWCPENIANCGASHFKTVYTLKEEQ